MLRALVEAAIHHLGLEEDLFLGEEASHCLYSIQSLEEVVEEEEF
jgi:hypothetical protein